VASARSLYRPHLGGPVRVGITGRLVLRDATTGDASSLGLHTEQVLGRRTLPLACLFLGLGILLTACTSSGASTVEQGSSPRSACSLLTAHEATNALGGPVQAPSECTTSTGNQSVGLYHVSGGPRTLLVHVSWDERSVTTFTVAHSGRAKYLDEAAPPQYGKATVAGVPAYWQLSPAPGPGNTQSLSSLKTGYVVTLSSMGLSQSRVERALAVILGHL
jgi:hypothetical protein